MALDPLRQAVVIAPHVAQYSGAGKRSYVYSIPAMPSIAVSDLTTVGETADLTSKAFAYTDITVTGTEKGYMSILPDKAAEENVVGDLVPRIADQAGRALGEKTDTDIAALFGALNGGTDVGTSGSTMTVNIFLDAIYTLELNNVVGSLAAFLHPVQVHSLRKAVNASSATTIERFLAQKAAPGGFVGNLYGVDTYQTSVIATDNGATADRVGAMMGTGSESPIALVTWRPIRVATQRDESRRATEIVVTTIYGVAEQRDKAGVQILAK